MAKARSIDDLLSRISALRDQPIDEVATDLLRRALQSKENVVIAKVAGVVASRRVRGLEDELIGAFNRLLPGGAKSDKGCLAKTAIARAMDELEADCTDVFLAAVRCVQREGSFGPPVDTAVELRGIGAGGLVRCRYREAMEELVQLLVDPEPAARIATVRAIAYDGRDAGALLLRYKTLAGDEEIDVVAECFAGLLRMSPAKSIDFVARFLDHANEEIRESAALALGASRQPAALEVLKAQWERNLDPRHRRLMFLAIAQMRSEPAIEFLISQISAGGKQAALDALEALAPYRQDPNLHARLAAAVDQRDDLAVREAFKRRFG